ncbi:hypothetical protein J2S09_002913 [Bacillus fengqiuensis]|nr:hypothetical protein [Bacillus fengqiuensis]
MVSLFVIGTVAVYAAVGKYVLKGLHSAQKA